MLFLLAALGLTAGMLAFDAFDDDDDAAVTPPPADEEDPAQEPIDADTGASFAQTDDGVEIELGEDETRSLVGVYYSDTEEGEDENGFGAIVRQVDEARFYLVPGEIDWFDLEYSDLQNYELSDFEEEYDMELLGSVDLLGVPDFIDTPDERVGTVETNAPIQNFLIRAETDGDLLEDIRAGLSEPNFRGVLEEDVTQNTSGSENTDWISTEENGIELSGLGGADLLESSGDTATLLGGEGNDDLITSGNGAIALGGPGDDDLDITGIGVVAEGGPGDDIIVVGQGTALGEDGNDDLRITDGEARGGEGDDRVASSGSGMASLYGESGDDTLVAFADGSTAFGGVGDDEIRVGTGALGIGEEGNDTIRVSGDSQGFGGAGDDRFLVDYFIPNENGSASVIGGDGADTIEVRPRYAVVSGSFDDDYLRITDFNPAEDMLELSVSQAGNRIVDFEIIEASDGSATEVVVTYLRNDASVTITLEGTTGVTEDNIIVVN